MLLATPPIAPDPPPVKIGVACRAASVTMTLKFDGKTYLIHTVEICGGKVVLTGKRIRIAR